MPAASWRSARRSGIDPIVDSVFDAWVVAEGPPGRPAVVIPRSRASAYRTGEHRFSLDPRDPLGDGIPAALSRPAMLGRTHGTHAGGSTGGEVGFIISTIVTAITFSVVV